MASQLDDLWLANQAVMTQMLFDATKETLLELVGDDKFCGGTPGIIAVLHTWGRSLCLHPHIHCVLTRGGLDADGHWHDPKRNQFIPVRVLSVLFRGKFLAAVRAALKTGVLVLPKGETDESVNDAIAAAYELKWAPFICPAGNDPQRVIEYLARYISGGPMGNSRIISRENGTVTFKHRNYRKKDAHGRPVEEPMTLTEEEFFRRWLIHVRLPFAKTIRLFGAYSPSYKGPIPESLRLKAAVSIPEDSAESPACLDTMKCPECGAALKVVSIARRNLSRAPPIGRVA